MIAITREQARVFFWVVVGVAFLVWLMMKSPKEQNPPPALAPAT
jgi:hypothetical protein